MIFAAILVYFKKNGHIHSDGLVGFSFLAAFELCGELMIAAAKILH